MRSTSENVRATQVVISVYTIQRVISRINEEIEIDLKLNVRAASVNYTPEITLANKWIVP